MVCGLVVSKVLLVSVRRRAQTGGQGWSVIFLWQQFCDTEPHYTNTRGQHTIQGRSRVREMVLFIVTLCSDQPRSDYCESDRKSRQGENMCNKASYSVIAGGTRLLFIRFIKLRGSGLFCWVKGDQRLPFAFEKASGNLWSPFHVIHVC